MAGVEAGNEGEGRESPPSWSAHDDGIGVLAPSDELPEVSVVAVPAPDEGAAGAAVDDFLVSCEGAAPLAGEAERALGVDEAELVDLVLSPLLFLFPPLWLLWWAGFFFSLGPALIQPSVAASGLALAGVELGADDDEARQLSEADALDMVGVEVKGLTGS